MRYPSVKTLRPLVDSVEQAQEIRNLLEVQKWSNLEALLWESGLYPHTAAWVRKCYHMPSYHEVKVAMVCERFGTFGVGFGQAYIPRGHNSKSPAIEYLNMGDPYCLTLMYLEGRWAVGCWGNIVERGRYD